LSADLYSVRQPQLHSQGDMGSRFVSQRLQQGQCLVQTCLPPCSFPPAPPSGDLTRCCL